MIPYCRNLLEKELVEWHKWYLPQKSIEGKTVLDVGAGCLPRGHLILGATKDISEYQAAEPVFSSRGLSLVTETHARPYSGRLYDIKGHGLLPFSLTPEHPVLVARTHLSYKGELHKSARRVVDGLEWRRAKDIRPMVGHRGNGDCLVFPKLKLEAPVPDFPLEYGRSPPDRYGRVTVKLEEQMAELLGLYVAEGDSQSVVGLNFGSHEKELVEHAGSLAKSVFPYRVRTRVRGSSAIVQFGSTPLARFLHSNFGDRARTKRLPDWMLLAPRHILAPFLKGIWEGHGYYSTSMHKGHPIFSLGIRTSSIALAMGIQLALSKFDIFARINRSDRIGTGRFAGSSEIYDVRMSGVNPNINEVFGVFPRSGTGRITRRFGEDTANFYMPVRNVKTLEYKGTVFNLTTASNDYLVSNIIVHNCGETAFFYLKHGAKHVICVEPPGEALQMLKKNFGGDSRVTIVESSVDMIKSDIEGAELDAVFEIHFPVKFEKIAEGSDPHASIWRIKKK